MPEVAEDPTEGVLAEWLVEESGAFVGAQSLATVETEKLLVSVEVAEPGVLVKMLVAAGAQVDPGTPLAVLADVDEYVGDLDSLLVELGLAEAPRVEPTIPPVENGVPLVEPDQTMVPPDEDVESTPPSLPRRLASELRRLSTPDDPAPDDERRTRSVADVLGLTVTHPAAPPTAVFPDPEAEPEPEPAAALEPEAEPEPAPERVASADASTSVASIAQLQLRERVRAEPLEAVLAELNAESERVSLAELIGRAVAAAQARVPLGDGGEVTVVDPGELAVAELSVDVTPTRRAVLAVGALREEPVVDDGALTVGKVFTVTLSVDQQLADPVLAAHWIGVLVTMLEHPVRLLA
jgi:pyruvate dehydrogenase E2 component (dihydrolipoamide acetyltransferase)